jgi:F-type H+-transporting ATPase subunit epsilon
MVWQGSAVSLIVRTTEGDIGILANHEAMMAALVPTAAEIVTPDGRREVVAVEGGFVSVFDNHVSLLTDSATPASEISLDEARHELAAMHEMMESGEGSEAEVRRYNQLLSQVKAGEKYEELKH